MKSAAKKEERGGKERGGGGGEFLPFAAKDAPRDCGHLSTTVA
jgi:hypothetical protein